MSLQGEYFVFEAEPAGDLVCLPVAVKTEEERVYSNYCYGFAFHC